LALLSALPVTAAYQPDRQLRITLTPEPILGSAEFTDLLLNTASEDPAWSGAVWSQENQTLTVYSHGEMSAKVQELSQQHPPGMTVTLANAPYSYRALSDARLRAFAEVADASSVSVLPNGTGLRVGIILADKSHEPSRTQLELLEQGVDIGVPYTLYLDEEPGMYGRLSDTTPFKGGGRIVNTQNGSACTTGFAAVNKSTGNEVLITASHCGDRGDALDSGGGNDVGSLSPNAYARMDAQAIQGENYAPRFFVGPRATTTTRDVRDLAGVVAGGQIFCLSGSYTGTVCNNEVVDSDFMPSPDRGPYAVLQQQNYINSAGQGDSGGPAYAVIPNSDDAKILGSILGPRFPYNQDTCFNPTRLCSDTIYVNVFRRFKDDMNLRLMIA
jgi:hypothetical protein